MHSLTSTKALSWIVHSSVCAAAGLPQKFWTSCFPGKCLLMWWWAAQGTLCHSATGGLVISISKMLPDQHQGTASSQTGPLVMSFRKACISHFSQFNHHWIFPRAAERGPTGSIQTPKSGALSAALTMATAACKWLTPPTFIWSRSPMTRWVHVEQDVLRHGKSKRMQFMEEHFSINNDRNHFCFFQYGKVIDSIWVEKEKHGFSAWLWGPSLKNKETAQKRVLSFRQPAMQRLFF